MSNVNYITTLLVSRDDISRECRPTSVECAFANRCIEEAQMLDIKPAVGDTIFMQLFDSNKPDDVQRLWDGGEYVDDCGNSHVFAGLRKALLYYSYARIVRGSLGVSTRFGFNVKADQYSDDADIKAKVQAYNEAFAIADGYKAQCLVYIADVMGDCCKRVIRNNRLAVKKIGY